MAEMPKRTETITVPIRPEFTYTSMPDEQLRVIALDAAKSIIASRPSGLVAPELALITIAKAAYKFLKEGQ